MVEEDLTISEALRIAEEKKKAVRRGVGESTTERDIAEGDFPALKEQLRLEREREELNERVGLGASQYPGYEAIVSAESKRVKEPKTAADLTAEEKRALVYKTSSSEYGVVPMEKTHLPTVYRPVNNKFTQSMSASGAGSRPGVKMNTTVTQHQVLSSKYCETGAL